MNPSRNSLLANLPESEYRKLTEHMELVSLTKGQDLFLPGEVPAYIHYPVGAIVSVMIDMPDGYSVETYMMGKTVAVGLAGLLGASFFRANVRDSGLAYRLAMPVFRRLHRECPAHASALTAQMMRMVKQMSQSVVCGKRHSVEQQLIRWMLITLDRALEPVIRCTHQEIAERLGFRREAITLALGKLTALGYILSRRGEVQVLQRDRLETLVCDCYWVGQDKVKPDAARQGHARTSLYFD